MYQLRPHGLSGVFTITPLVAFVKGSTVLSTDHGVLRTYALHFPPLLSGTGSSRSTGGLGSLAVLVCRTCVIYIALPNEEGTRIVPGNQSSNRWHHGG